MIDAMQVEDALTTPLIEEVTIEERIGSGTYSKVAKGHLADGRPVKNICSWNFRKGNSFHTNNSNSSEEFLFVKKETTTKR